MSPIQIFDKKVQATDYAGREEGHFFPSDISAEKKSEQEIDIETCQGFVISKGSLGKIFNHNFDEQVFTVKYYLVTHRIAVIEISFYCIAESTDSALLIKGSL